MSFALRQRVMAVLMRQQGGVCPACGEPLTRTVVIDHDHTTDLVRGLLHGPCNTREGQAIEDDPQWAEYRRNPPAAQAGLTVYYSDFSVPPRKVG